MAMIVQKYGGSSVADAERVRNVARRITDTYKAGNDVVVILSAQGDTTDDLIEKAREINPDASKREMDMLLSNGEQISIALCAMAIEALGFPVISLAGWQIGMHTDSDYGNARITRVDGSRLRAELDRKNIVLVAGFQGINKFDDVTTLGRGGSDTTAVAVATALNADVCQIYTDVDGVYTADPRIVKNAKKLDEITYDEMLELATLGAQVLHNRSVEMAKRYHITLEVLSSLENRPGTKVKEVVNMEAMKVSGVARDNNAARISLTNLPDVPGMAFKLFSLLSHEKINVDIILQSIGRGSNKDISFTVAQTALQQARDVLEHHRESLGYEEMIVRDDVAKLSIVGSGMVNNPGVAASMFEALYRAGVNIQMISTSEIKVSVLIDRAMCDKAVQAVHEQFFGA